MTRDEEVRNAIDTIIPIFRSNNGRTYEQALMASGFEAGVKWADTHPKSTWISVKDDLPCKHEELMRQKEVREGTETIDVFAASKSGLIWNDYMMYENGKWRWNGNNFEPDFWMLAPKLPKE